MVTQATRSGDLSNTLLYMVPTWGILINTGPPSRPPQLPSGQLLGNKCDLPINQSLNPFIYTNS